MPSPKKTISRWVEDAETFLNATGKGHLKERIRKRSREEMRESLLELFGLSSEHLLAEERIRLKPA